MITAASIIGAAALFRRALTLSVGDVARRAAAAAAADFLLQRQIGPTLRRAAAWCAPSPPPQHARGAIVRSIIPRSTRTQRRQERGVGSGYSGGTGRGGG